VWVTVSIDDQLEPTQAPGLTAAVVDVKPVEELVVPLVLSGLEKYSWLELSAPPSWSNAGRTGVGSLNASRCISGMGLSCHNQSLLGHN